MFMGVQVPMHLHVYMCAHVYSMCRGQRATPNVVLQVLPTLFFFFEEGSYMALTTLEEVGWAESPKYLLISASTAL